ncbi:hypothetical protein ACMFMF_003200 [Clarireedia jacksonii]
MVYMKYKFSDMGSSRQSRRVDWLLGVMGYPAFSTDYTTPPRSNRLSRWQSDCSRSWLLASLVSQADAV